MTKPRLLNRHRIIPALLAGGACTLAGQPAQAVQLGQLEVQSGLGQPLRASIAYALSPNEQLHDYCIFINPGASSGIPALTRAQLTLSAGRINIASNAPVREPMVTIGLTVNCPYSANLTRSYTLLLDPVPKLEATETNRRATAQAATRPTPAPDARQTAVRTQAQAAPVPREPAAAIPTSGSYRVRVGDTLSGIAARIENRPVGLWQAVDAIFKANPDAFVDGDLNRLKAGSVLALPAFGNSVTTVSRRTAPAAEPKPATAEQAPLDQPTATTSTPTVTTTTAPAADPVVSATTEPAGDTRPAEEQANTATPGAFPTISEIEANPGAESASDAALPQGTGVTTEQMPAAAADNQQLPVEASETLSFVSNDDGSSQLLYALGGAGLALFLGLVAFRSRSRFGDPAAPATATDVAADFQDSDNVPQPAVNAAIDFDIGVAADRHDDVTLDADLSAGTGLNDAADVEVAQDFGFSTTMDLSAGGNAKLASGATITGQRPAADALPGHRFVEESILEKEILPNDDEYDLSMVIDATKQPIAEDDVTAKDLVAIAVASDAGNSEDDSDGYTLNEEVDLATLEQDYEDELTATQALNAEMEEAAANLSQSIASFDETDTAKIIAIDAASSATGSRKRIVVEDDDDETAVLTDLDDTGINEALLPNHDDLTAEIPHRRETDKTAIDWSFEGTAEMPAASDENRDRLAETSANTQLTEELPTAENDPTLEMDVESGHFRTRKLRG